MDLINIIKALSHQNRLRILNLIQQKQLCVCEIEYIMEINQSNVSRHLNKLKQADIIYGKHRAQWIYYRINPEILQDHLFLKIMFENELDKLDVCLKDNKRLEDYQKSNLSCEDLP